MSENYDLISENDMHMPIRCIMQRFDHIRSQMHDYFELSMIVSRNCTLQLDDHTVYTLKFMTCSVLIHSRFMNFMVSTV